MYVDWTNFSRCARARAFRCSALSAWWGDDGGGERRQVPLRISHARAPYARRTNDEH
jgi:hypothetical protein